MDFITTAPGASPTEGLDENASSGPYVPSTAGDILSAGIGRDTSWLLDKLGEEVAEHGGYAPAPSGISGVGPVPGGGTGQYVAPEPREAPEALKAEFPGVRHIDEPLPRSVVQSMAHQQVADDWRADIQARYPAGLGHQVLGFGAGAIASLLDPVDDAAFMVPVVGEARYAQWLGRAGEAAGIFGRGAVTLGVGAARGAVGGGILAGGRYALGDPDMTLGDVAQQTLEAAAGGAVLHSALGFRSDVLGARFSDSAEGQAALSDTTLHDNAARVAAAQMADGQPVEVRPIFEADQASQLRQSLLNGTAIGRVYLPTMPPSVDTLARQAEPDLFQRYDALAADRDQHRATVQALGADREQLPEAVEAREQVATILGKVNGVRSRLTNVAAARLSDAEDRLDQILTTDTPEMAEARQRLMQADYGMRDMAEDVAASYRRAAQQLPEDQVFSPARSYLDEAVARAAGQPSEQAVRLEDAAAEAKANPTDKVLAAQMAEAERTVEELRRQGLLTPEDEGELQFGAAEAAEHPAPKGWEVAEPEKPRPEGQQRELAPGVVATLADGSTPEEATLIDGIKGIIERLAPKAEVVPARLIETGSESSERLGLEGRSQISGYTAVGPQRQLIAWSLESPDAEATAKHEAVHFLRHTGLIQSDEWETLAKAAEDKGWLGEFRIGERYPNADPETQTEEAIASAFAKWRQSPSWVPKAVRPIFAKIQSALDQIGDFVRRTFGADATADDVFSRLASGEIGRRAPEGGAAPFGAAEAPAAEQMDEAVEARKRLTAMQDLIKRHALAQKVADIRAQGLSLAHGFDALTRGISEAVPGARDSTAQQQLARQNEFMGRFVANLEKVPGAMTAWRQRTETANWVRELAELNKADGQTGVTKSPLALEIAKAVHDAQDLARFRLNSSGAWIGDYEGYVARTQHDAVKIHNAGYEQWRADTLAGLDQEKTFAGVPEAEREPFMRNLWDALSTGVHLSSDHGVSPKAAAFSGPGNMGQRASSERVLHWKDADAWRDYQEKYGDAVIERGVMNSLVRAGRDAALMERWGSNPQVAFDNLIRQVRGTYRDDHDALRHFDAQLPRIREEFAHLTGEASRPGTSLAWKIRGSILALQDITKLGNVLLAHLSTAVTKPFQLQYHGIGRWQAYTSVLRNLMQDTSSEGRAVLENLRANATGQFQNLMSGYEPVDGIPGQIAALRQMSMRLGGLPWMLGRQKSGAEWELANFLGQNVGKRFEELQSRTQRGITIYGITPAEWDALRQAPDHDRDGSGSIYLTPAAALKANVDSLATERLAKAGDDENAERIRSDVRDRLAMKLAAYYADAAERATVTPGIPERAFFSQYGGRFWGPVVGQYKSWAMAAVRQMWGQAVHGSSRAEAVKSLAELVAVGTAIGYARLALTSAINGETPEGFTDDPRHNVEMMGKAMVAGGGLGIWGDYLMGQYSRTGETAQDHAKDLALNILGPAFSDAAAVYGLARNVASIPFAGDTDSAFRRAGADGMKVMTGHLPFVNLWYLRLLSRWLFIDRLNEMASPGYLQRHQDAVKNRTGQDFWLPLTAYAGASAQ